MLTEVDRMDTHQREAQPLLPFPLKWPIDTVLSSLLFFFLILFSYFLLVFYQ
jgi:hypothetical protein